MHAAFCKLVALSIDVQIGPVKGDLTKQGALAFWVNAIRAGKMFGIPAGPLCETWRASRWRAIEGGAPRLLRTHERPRGVQAASQTDLHQLALGSDRYRRTILLITT
eukprot:8334739-Pyramimonas_sp.AAC.1